MKYVAPSITETAFNCPHCGVLTSQQWHEVMATPSPNGEVGESDLRLALMGGKLPAPSINEDRRQKIVVSVDNVRISQCYNCRKPTFWISGSVAWPFRGDAPPANSDMPADILEDYNEAGAILDRSPRGSAALLRLAVQKLCKELGQPGKDIFADIAALVASGVSPIVQEALDAVRVIGNDSVHGGQIDLRGDRPTAQALFQLINIIVDKTISEPTLQTH